MRRFHAEEFRGSDAADDSRDDFRERSRTLQSGRSDGAQPLMTLFCRLLARSIQRKDLHIKPSQSGSQ